MKAKYIGLDIGAALRVKEPTILHLEQSRITLKGLEYLQENSMMKKIADAAKGIVNIVT